MHGASLVLALQWRQRLPSSLPSSLPVASHCRVLCALGGQLLAYLQPILLIAGHPDVAMRGCGGWLRLCVPLTGREDAAATPTYALALPPPAHAIGMVPPWPLGDGGWDSLGHDLHLLVLSVLKQRRKKDSLQAVMQTSRDLRLLASSLVSAIEIRDAFALAHYPRYAAAITSMWLWMRPFHGETHMEPPFMVNWLQATSAAGNRLAAVTSVEVELPGGRRGGRAIDPITMDSLLASIARACPNLRCLHIEDIVCEEEDVVRAMFSAIGQHLPGIIELQLEPYGDDPVHYAIAGIDWAACLPRGLQKFSGYMYLHHELLQQLVLMPSLTEVEVLGLSIDGEELLEVQSEACAWRILRLTEDAPLFLDLGRFTAAMPLLHLDCLGDSWFLRAAEEGPATMAKAAAWLSQISNCPNALSLRFIYTIPTASTAGLISSLAPVSGPLVSLALIDWPVSEGNLDELAAALPNVHKLTLTSCSISSGTWAVWRR